MRILHSQGRVTLLGGVEAVSPAIPVTAIDHWLTLRPDLGAADLADETLEIALAVEYQNDAGEWTPSHGCTFRLGRRRDDTGVLQDPAPFLAFPRVLGKVYQPKDRSTRFADLADRVLRVRIRPSRTIAVGLTAESIEAADLLDLEPLKPPASISVAQTKATAIAASVTSLAVSFDSTPSVGQHCVAFCGVRHTALGTPQIDCNDNQSNTYTEDANISQGRARSEFNTAPITTASGTFTVTIDSDVVTTNLVLGLLAAAGQDTTTPIEAVNSGGGSSTSPTSNGVTPAANALYCAFAVCQTVSQTITEEGGVGWTLLSESEGGQVVHSALYQIGSGSKTANWTLGTGGNWAATIVAVKELATGGAGQPARRRVGRRPHGLEGVEVH